ncbi:cell envelope integrity protein TolA [Geminicoccus flavidas]|uniref:cell envelope integrity protein TolA n=1 Tax=Geminicoccus flavidas TaxID=2506407 RepID=UPI00135CB8BC|nr:cell envelope integrity protein TolA [Geminicoccus flavidas]
MQCRVVGLCAILALSGCATQPDNITTQYVSPVQYRGYDCNQISLEMQRISGRVSQLHASLDTKADNDAAQMALGMVIFWPALFFLEGGDGPEAAEYARLKGEYDALQQMNVQKSCHLPQDPGVLQPLPQPPPVEVASAAVAAPAPALTYAAPPVSQAAPPTAPVVFAAVAPDAASANTTPPANPVVVAAAPVRTLPRSTASTRPRAVALAASLQEQITPCWTVPQEAVPLQNQGVRINLRILPDGSVESAMPVERARIQSDPAYRLLAESAERAALLCSPLTLPSEDYEVWKDIILNFRKVGTGGA